MNYNSYNGNELVFIMEETKMPNRDGTGPNGEGPKTGRKKGPCK